MDELLSGLRAAAESTPTTSSPRTAAKRTSALPSELNAWIKA